MVVILVVIQAVDVVWADVSTEGYPGNSGANGASTESERVHTEQAASRAERVADHAAWGLLLLNRCPPWEKLSFLRRHTRRTWGTTATCAFFETRFWGTHLLGKVRRYFLAYLKCSSMVVDDGAH